MNQAYFVQSTGHLHVAVKLIVTINSNNLGKLPIAETRRYYL